MGWATMPAGWLAREEATMVYIIETRTQETEDRAAGPWRRDGLTSVIGEDWISCDSPEEAEEVIRRLRACGPDWAAAEYRYREVHG
jgi:hypothetical protein